MTIEIVAMKFEHKYVYFVYEVRNGDTLIDTHDIQYSFEDFLTLTESDVQAVLKDCLRGFIKAKAADKTKFNQFIGMKVSDVQA